MRYKLNGGQQFNSINTIKETKITISTLYSVWRDKIKKHRNTIFSFSIILPIIQP